MNEVFPAFLVKAIEKAKNICVLTGAGISAESGIATFRGKEGLWSRYRPEDLANYQAFINDPDLVWQWYQHRREAVSKASPNAGHKALAEWEELAPVFTLITQNVDSLHRAAGSRNVLELHGNIRVNRCLTCGAETDMADITYNGVVPHCTCGGLLRPGVVWFGESLPETVLEAAVAAVATCDLFLSVGTSALVYPAAMLPEFALRHEAVVVEVNPEETPLTPRVSYHVRGPAGTVLPELVALYRQARSAFPR